MQGLVQGVGFRPFVYRQARRLGLAGWVKNTSAGVELEAEGHPGAIDALVAALRQGPPLARTDQLRQDSRALRGDESFVILPSEDSAGPAALVGPDVATCRACLAELRDPGDRRHGYPFVNCTDCGPRFTIVRGIPYDRPLTTMAGFPLCPDCAGEYADPMDRRFHAEPNACPRCGPRLMLLDPQGCAMSGAPLLEAQRMLREGALLAVKGLGGYHLVCDARSERTVRRLRRRKRRPAKPLALMCRDLAVARQLCLLDEREQALLCGPQRPILILRRRRQRTGQRGVAAAVAPGQRCLGLMLPYTPLHHLLLAPDALSCLVMTSGNRSGGPLVADDREALRVLGPMTDALLMHDRPIANRCDDSLGYVEGQGPVLLRRSRGYVPLPLQLERAMPPALALGAGMHNCFALARGRQAFLSQHIGHTDDQDVLAFMEQAMAHFQRWLDLEPELVACDLHPDLATSHLARQLARGRELVRVQHHHAHLAAACVAAGQEGAVQGLVLDGTGYGPDGTVWGGEILVGDASGVRRAGHLRPLPLPGGEAAVRRPWRVAVGWLHVLAPELAQQALPLWERGASGELALVRRMVDRQFNAPLSSSAGRLFDAVAALLGLRDQVSYRGQAAIELEQLALAGAPGFAAEPLARQRRTGRWVLDPAPLLRSLVRGLRAGLGPADLALAFHVSLAEALVGVCRALREEGAPQRVALCGGVFQNRILARICARGLKEDGLKPIMPGEVPVGDGGLALGQLAVAAARARGEDASLEWR